MSRLKAEEARKIANDNSDIIQNHLYQIFDLIVLEAKQGRFKLNYASDISDPALINPIMEQLSVMGYDVESYSVKDISFMIKW